MSISTNQHGRQEVHGVGKGQSTGLFGFTMIVFAISTILISGYLFWLAPMMKQSKLSEQQIELEQLKMALEQYNIEFGEYPPGTSRKQIEIHVRQSHSPTIDFDSACKNLQYDPESLDERELLCFWLNGKAWQRMSGSDRDFKMYEFDGGRLVDRDNDGWVEYQDKSGNYFVLRSGVPLILDPSMNSTTQKQDE